MKRITTVIVAAAAWLGTLAMPTITLAADDDHNQIVHLMKKTFEAARMAANRLPTFQDGMVLQRHRAAPGNLDYNSFGYWLNAAPRSNARPPIGAWAAGPVGWSAPALPLTGGASYEGTSRGYFSQHIKTSSLATFENSRIEGEFTAPVLLWATFGNLHKESMLVLQGWVGDCCNSGKTGIKVTGRLVDVDGKSPTGPINLDYPRGRVEMGATLNSDGTWRSNDVRLDLGGGLAGGTVTNTGGAWGGRLIAGDEFPASAIGEKAIGTVGAWSTDADGNKAVLLGAFETGPGEPKNIWHFGDGYDGACVGIAGRCDP